MDPLEPLSFRMNTGRTTRGPRWGEGGSPAESLKPGHAQTLSGEHFRLLGKILDHHLHTSNLFICREAHRVFQRKSWNLITRTNKLNSTVVQKHKTICSPRLPWCRPLVYRPCSIDRCLPAPLQLPSLHPRLHYFIASSILYTAFSIVSSLTLAQHENLLFISVPHRNVVLHPIYSPSRE